MRGVQHPQAIRLFSHRASPQILGRTGGAENKRGKTFTMKPKRKKPFNATAASIKLLVADNWTCGKVEQRIPHTFITRDLFNMFDLVIMSPTRGLAGVQVTGGTSTSNFLARVRKIKENPLHAIWLASGGRIIVHSWEKRAGKKERECRILEITKPLVDK
jgi:hypothetical protein